MDLVSYCDDNTHEINSKYCYNENRKVEMDGVLAYICLRFKGMEIEICDLLRKRMNFMKQHMY